MLQNYRIFWLENSQGKQYFFSDTDNPPTKRPTDVANSGVKVFLDSPEGLGFEKTYTSTQLGNTEIIDDETYKFKDFECNLLFYDSNNSTKYNNYFSFIQFLKYKPIELHCLTPQSETEYYCSVLVISTEKTEVDKTKDALEIPLKLHMQTQWQTSDFTIHTLTNDRQGGKYYPLTRPYNYEGTGLQNVKIVNNGTAEVGFILQVVGTITTSMYLTLSQDGEIYGGCKLLGNFTEVTVNSIDDQQEIILKNGSSVLTNPLSYQDFSIADGKKYVTFVKLKVGESILNFTCGNIESFDGTVYIKYRQSYISI